ncbi:uncharacterized protein LAESUDRAFT_814693 [Laetiporus sulphureus 93-53]|uniref:Uncharacterized protein n=1 Tax=Laetiporus sulphureus 93-53 TaxID=1314785 RepID=A0A165CT55_9APHY|nr:uncharacterized protein LAESUDRAFT_814693 [Laetiporus sulphureus 93-53]KZT03393.1 hypothetical protein LAESUDRAFT_814693 [Laetiporus sulphureus 93-53]
MFASKDHETEGVNKNAQRRFLMNSNYSRGQLEDATVSSTPNGKGVHIRWYYDEMVEDHSWKKGSPALDVLGLLDHEATLTASETEALQLLRARSGEEDENLQAPSTHLLDTEPRIYDIESVPFDPATITAVRDYFALGMDEISDYRLLANLVSMHKAHEAHTTYQADAQDPARERRNLEQQRYRMKAQKAYEQAMWKRGEEAGAFDELESREQEERKRQEFEQGSSKGRGRTRR